MNLVLPLLLALSACHPPEPTASLPSATVPPPESSDDTADTGGDRYYPTGGATGCAIVDAPLWAALLALCLRRRRLALLLPSTALAAPQLNVQRLDPAHPSTGFLTVHSARLLPRGRVSFDALGHWAWRPFQQSVSVGGALVRDRAGIDHLTAVNMRVAVAPVDWMQLSVGAPVIQFVSTGPGLTTFGGEATDTVGWGDLAGEITFRPIGEERGAGLALSIGANFPTGTDELLLTRQVVTPQVRFSLSGAPGLAHLAAHVGYRLLPGSNDLNDHVAIDDELFYGAGLGLLLYRDIVRFNIEAAGLAIVGPGMNRVVQEDVTPRLHNALEVGGNLRIATDSGFVVTLGATAGLTPAPGVPTARVLAGLAYAPSLPPDLDRDGISNFDDDCRRDPEDMDEFQDADGCPDLDNDGDGLADLDDACPDDPEDLDGFEDEDGCPDRDNDADRIADLADTCPDDPEDRDRHQDDDGCPDPDNDGDGVPDTSDRCPDSAEDVDGFSDDDGCPEEEYDRDADGLIDNYDPCPEEPEDFDNFFDDDGCPEPDNDADGIPDPVDLCPDVPEIINGEADEDGCPDETKAVLKGDRIIILERVYFYVNEARIKPESFDVLQAVANTMVANPQVTLLRVEGHTDGDGSDSYNLKLSEQRAESVRDWLVQAGVDATRLTWRGYGEQFPVATNRTSEGKEANRRVEFVVVPPGEGPVAPGEVP